MKKKSNVITATLITIIAAVLCATILITAITHRDWFSGSSYTSSDTSSTIETIIIEETIVEETSSTESTTQETASITSQTTTTSSSTAQSSSNNSSEHVSSNTNESNSGNKVVQTADPETGISWDGVSPIIYTYSDGTTGTEKRDGATYEYLPGWITTVVTIEKGTGEADLTCDECGKEMGDGTNDTCLMYWTGGDHACPNCGTIIPEDTCHTCSQ